MRPVRQNRFAICLCTVRRCCVVQIAYESFLDCCLLEIFCFQDGEQHLRTSPRFQYHLINTFVKGDSLSPLTIPLRRAEPARPQLPAARILQPLPASPKNFPFCAFLPLSAFPPHFLFPSHASCPFSSNASAPCPLFIAKYLINPLRFFSKLFLFKRIFATFQRQS